ncbi:transposase [Actinomadura sp. BRA 177]|uniref:RNA-guided endonuclease InsQ/TnpB family protein n=1 Tax=Actinomadura sp. BRA 177 TaxID=2745202 RepID=UPI0028153E0E|nr:transposase [Actinomadura sp. BRA 177]
MLRRPQSRRARRAGRPACDQTGRGRLHHLARQHPQRQPRRPAVAATPKSRVQTHRLPPRRRAHLRRPQPFVAVGRRHRQHLDGGRAVQKPAVRLLTRPGQDTGRAPQRRIRPGPPGREVVPAGHLRCPRTQVYEPADWIGVDRGIVNLATTSDGDNHQGRRLDRYRRWQARKRAQIQAKRTRSAARLLKKRARREARHATHVNHKIAKQVVAVAARTGRGIALEELSGIRGRVTVPRDQRARLSSWPFHQLGEFIAYKARRHGVPYIEVDPAYTSQRCPRCGHTARNNRPSRDHFECRRCGLAGPADVVAGVNVRDRARSAWVFVNMPQPAPT